MTEEMFIEKPAGKPVKNFKARVKVYDNDVVVVNPQEPRLSRKENLPFTRAREKRRVHTAFILTWMRTTQTP